MAESVATPTTDQPNARIDLVGDTIEEVSSALAPIKAYFSEVYHTLAAQAFSISGGIQLSAIVLTGLFAWLLSKPLHKLIDNSWPKTTLFAGVRTRAMVRSLVMPFLWVLGIWVATALLGQLGFGNDLIRVAASLLNAWIVIRLFTSLVADSTWSRMFATFAWIVAALNILKLLQPTVDLLESAAISIGDSRVSLFMVIKGAIFAILFIWIAAVLSRFVHDRLSRSRSFTPSVQALLAQSARLFLIFIAIMLALNVIGIDLTALAVFSGAVGVGIGFGLQAIFSNFVAGIIILLERSVRVGDFVELESGLNGEVSEINIRATTITTNDNVDILVPNSEFINQRMTSWTLREGHRRLRVPFGVAYGSDKELVKKAALEAAEKVDYMLTSSDRFAPQVWLTEFGDSSLNFELVVWLKPEAVKRPSRVTADYNWHIETALAKYGLEIPFPQRDLHIRSGTLPVRIVTAPEQADQNMSNDEQEAKDAG